MKRILLFLATNIAVLVVLSIVLRLLGVDRILDESGMNLNMVNLLVFAAVFGFGGAFISLAMSKWMAKRMMGAQVITNPQSATETWLVDTVKKHAQMANIGMPEVAIFNSPSPNAFATGMNKNKALVAVSAGLLHAMNKEEVEAVIGHEISHVANGDMITLSLIQGVVNTFVIFLSRIVGHFVDRVILKNEEEGHGIGFFVTSLVAQIVFGILASVIVMWFSRKREFIADAGGAKLAGTQNMINALEALKRGTAEPLPDQMAAFGINGKPSGHGLKLLFMSHPPLEDRIEALKKLTYR
ncbi:MAG TPA: protease HtpX [Smithella sp.]|jgi:heat shock protein HtpX|nr:protease HtpX [Smithella sp.]HNQ64924.1 protease HtpX [Smithella sp.]HOE33121.1 protease HtpX [Smithella sp.]HOO35988.1 protease HtpX [Smithella sp.]HOS13521.1 protease HtpX [Smithella sp.]